MTETLFHQIMMLRPMQAGISGYARLQGEAGRQLVQIHLRGLEGGSIRAFWYAGEGLARELGCSPANAKGEAGLYTEVATDAVAPARLAALLIMDGGEKPRPLAIGLCAAQSAGSLMDAKNALLALCDKLGRQAAAQADPLQNRGSASSCEARKPATFSPGGMPKGRAEPGKTTPALAAGQMIADGNGSEPEQNVSTAITASPAPKQHSKRSPGSRCTTGRLPREVFLPAIDTQRERRRSRRDAAQTPVSVTGTDVDSKEQTPPNNAAPATGGASCANTAQQPARRNAGAAADRLPDLHWPQPFAQVAQYFDRLMPSGIPGWPGWRFVQVKPGPAGLWIGAHQKHGRVEYIAYVLPQTAPPPTGKPFRPIRAADGSTLQALVMKA